MWAVPGPFGFAECRGSNALLADGAGVLWDLDRFVEAVAPPREAPQKLTTAEAGTTPAELPEKEAAALKHVGFEPTKVDVLAGRSGMEMRELLSALTLLELKGYVARDAGGAFVRNPTAGGSAGRSR